MSKRSYSDITSSNNSSKRARRSELETDDDHDKENESNEFTTVTKRSIENDTENFIEFDDDESDDVT
jgi:hypothetical protein